MKDSTPPNLSQEAVAAELDREITIWHAMKKDPVQFFSRRSDWSTQLSDVLARTSTFFWAAQFAPANRYHSEGEKGVYHYRNVWPLPVGKRSLRRHQAQIKENQTDGYYGDQIVLYDAMPFGGDELAIWILDARFGGARLECFGLTELQTRDPDGTEVYELGELATRLTSSGRAGDVLTTLEENVRDWWHSLKGTRVGPGRPPGSTDRTPTGVRNTLKTYVRQKERSEEGISKEDFLHHADIPHSSWNRYMKTWGTNWTELLEEIRRGYW